MPNEKPIDSRFSRKGSLAAVILAVVLALLAGWYAVALGWTALFLLDESPATGVFGVGVLVGPILFTLVAIFTWRGRYLAALWLLVPFALKWLAASVWAWTAGGVTEWLARLPGVSLVTMLDEGYVERYPLDQFILLIAQFQIEPFATIALAVMLRRLRRQ